MATDRLRDFAFLVKDTWQLYSKNFERHALALNMTLAQCKVLGHLERNEGISQVKLAELADTDPMTLVRILDRMEGDGWVERRAHPGDRRARQLFLKKASVPVRQEMWRIADQTRAEALTGLSAADREQLLSLLGKIHGNLNSRLAAAASAATGDSTSDDARPMTKQRAPKAAAMNTSAKPGRLSRKETKVSR